MKKYLPYFVLGLIVFSTIGCGNNKTKVEADLSQKNITFKLDEEINIDGYNEVNSIKTDIDGDEVYDIIKLIKDENNNKVYLQIIDGSNQKNLYIKEVDSMSSAVIDVKDATGDKVNDILIAVNTGELGNSILYYYKDGEYILAEQDTPKYNKGFLSDYSYYVMDIETYKYYKYNIPNDKKNFYLENGFYDKFGVPTNKLDNYTQEFNSSILKDMDGDNIYEILNRFSLKDISTNDKVMDVVEIMKYENGEFKLLEVKGDESNITHYDYSGLSITDIRNKIYDYTGEIEKEVDYQYTEDNLNLPNNIDKNYYKFYILYDSPDGGLAADSLVLVDKITLQMYRYYLDGLIFPL